MKTRAEGEFFLRDVDFGAPLLQGKPESLSHILLHVNHGWINSAEEPGFF